MADQIIGTKFSTNPGTPSNIPTGVNQYALVQFVGAQPGFIHRLGAWMGPFFTNQFPRPQLAVWEQAPNGLVGSLLGYTAPIVIASNSHVNYEAPIVWSAWDAANGVTGAGVRIVPGKTYWLGVHNEAASLAMWYLGSQAPHLAMWRSAPAGNPTNPFNPTGQISSAGWPTAYGVLTPSTAPVATTTGPAATVSTINPALSASFLDAESGAPTHDRVASYKIELRQVGTTALIWQPSPFVTTAAQRAAFAVSVPYAGATLDEATYEWRIQATDDSGAVGDWSGWHVFTIENVGEVDVTNASPVDKSESGQITTWTARWVHPTALNANGARVRILSGGVVVRGGDEAPFVTLSPTVPNNGFINLADTATLLTQGANGPLPSGIYTWQMQGRATDGSLTPWSDAVAFTINSPPNQPTGLRPISGSRLSARPRLDWLVSDPDIDDVLGADLTSEWELTRPNDTVISGTTGSVDPATGRGYVDLTATEAPINGDYQWRIRGVDQSAVAAGSGVGGWSAPALFTLIAAPIAAITAPTENQVILTSAPQISWSVSGGAQNFFRVQLYRPNQGVPFFGSGQQPASGDTGLYLIPGGVLQNGLTYDAEVTIWSAGDVVSTSAKRRFTVQHPSADIVNNVATSLFLFQGDYEATSVVVSWDQTGYADFAGYLVSRRLGSEEAGEAVILAHLRQAGQTSFVDYHAPPNESLIYAVSQLRRVGADIRQSPASESVIDVPLSTPVIASVLSGGSLRAPVMMLGDDYAEGFTKDETTVDTWGTGGLPTLVRSPENYGQRLYAVGISILTDERGTIQEHMTRWRDLVHSGHPVSLRTETERIFCHVVPSPNWLRRSVHNGVYEVELSLEEIAWEEAVVVKT